MLTKEERMQRVKEARKAYSTRPPRRSRSLEMIPRASIAPSNSAPPRPVTRPVPFKFAHGKKSSTTSVPRGGGGDVEDFKVDPKSMEMIESGNVVITNNSRPSLYNRYRNTLGGGGRGRGGLLQATRFRNSIAPAEPRVSLLPLGINILSATASQRAQVEGWMKQKCDEAATPAGKKTASDATKSIQKVRFQESPGGKDTEEDGGKRDGKVPTVHTPYVSKFDKNGSFMPPTAMRSALKNHRVNVNGLATPIPAARKLNFDDMSTIDDDESVVILDKENSQSDSSSIANSSNVSVMTGNLVQQCFRSITRLTQLELDQLTPDQVELIDQSFEMLKNYRTRIRMMGGKGGETQTARSGQQLVPITENEDDEEEEEVSDAFGALRIGATSPAPRTKPTTSVPTTFGILGPISEDF